MQKESTKLAKQFRRYGIRKVQFKFENIQFLNVQKCEILVKFPDQYEHTGKRNTEFGYTDQKL